MTSFEAQSGEPKRTREALQGAWGVQAEEAPAPGVLIAAGVDRAPQSGLGEAEGCTVPDSDTGLLCGNDQGVDWRPPARQVAAPEALPRKCTCLCL